MKALQQWMLATSLLVGPGGPDNRIVLLSDLPGRCHSLRPDDPRSRDGMQIAPRPFVAGMQQ